MTCLISACSMDQDDLFIYPHGSGTFASAYPGASLEASESPAGGANQLGGGKRLIGNFCEVSQTIWIFKVSGGMTAEPASKRDNWRQNCQL